jgi:hypothetical protein
MMFLSLWASVVMAGFFYLELRRGLRSIDSLILGSLYSFLLAANLYFFLEDFAARL